jgi:serine/threonine protein phosphatase PrpC
LLAVSELASSLTAAHGETTLLRTAVLNGIEAANDAVRSEVPGSATTLTVVTVEGRLARSYQVGDSEAIIVGQRGRIRLQTLAHSPTGFAVEAGFLDHRDALHHAERHLVSNFVGTDDMRIDIGPAIRLKTRDTILLASDGLTDNLHLEEVVNRIRCGPLENAGKTLISLAARRMGDSQSSMPSKPDDLSVLLFRKPLRGTAPPISGNEPQKAPGA